MDFRSLLESLSLPLSSLLVFLYDLFDCTLSFFFVISKSFLSFSLLSSSESELLLLPLLALTAFLFTSVSVFALSIDLERDLLLERLFDTDLERDLDDLESLETDRDFLDLLLSMLFDLDFFKRDREVERDERLLGFNDLDLDLRDRE